MPLDQYRPIYTGWKLLGPERIMEEFLDCTARSTRTSKSTSWPSALKTQSILAARLTSPLVSSLVGKNHPGTTLQHAGLDRAHCRNLRLVRSLGEYR